MTTRVIGSLDAPLQSELFDDTMEPATDLQVDLVEDGASESSRVSVIR